MRKNSLGDRIIVRGHSLLSAWGHALSHCAGIVWGHSLRETILRQL